MKEYLIAVDLEGVHGVSGMPYEQSVKAIAKGSDEYNRAVASATEEVNVAVDALFQCGADSVTVWDNHAGGGNLDFSLIDGRAKQYAPDKLKHRMKFLEEFRFSGVVLIGYHSRAGSPRGNLCHTYNGMEVQYMKIAGKQVGEFDIDCSIAAEYGVPLLFAASDDVCVGQILENFPQTETAVTKIGVSRRKVIFRDEKEVFAEIREGIARATSKEIKPIKLTFPCEFEIRYTRQEFAEWKLEAFAQKLPVRLGEDAHTICMTMRTIDDLRELIL